MEVNDYQKRAMATCLPSSENFSYMMLNLVGEVGEFASKVAKHIRKQEAFVGMHYLDADRQPQSTSDLFQGRLTEEQQYALMLEAGDIMWQIAGLCSVMGWDLEDVCQHNLLKLSKRKEAGTISGDGDGISGKERTK